MARSLIQSSSADDEAHVIALDRPEVLYRRDCGPPVAENSELWIVGSVAAWPVGEGYSPRGLGETGWTSNVTNAVGFLGGVLTRVIPYELCTFRSDGAPVTQECLLCYDRERATVRGTVRETRCGDGPIESVTVQLTEMDRDPARIRKAFSNRGGEFVIGALEPGVSHALWARAPQVPADSVFDVYSLSRERWPNARA